MLLLISQSVNCDVVTPAVNLPDQCRGFVCIRKIKCISDYQNNCKEYPYVTKDEWGENSADWKRL